MKVRRFSFQVEFAITQNYLASATTFVYTFCILAKSLDKLFVCVIAYLVLIWVILWFLEF